MQDDAADDHGFLLKVPMYDKSGKVVQINKRVIRGISAEQLDVLKTRIDDQSKKMAALQAAGNHREIHPMVVSEDHETSP